MNILVADDHKQVRTRLIRLLRENFHPNNIVEAWDFISLLDKAVLKDWEIIISDLAMPGGNGIEVIRKIRLQNPTQRILVISINEEDRYAEHSRGAGAAGYVNKNKVTDELVPAIRLILDGKQYFPTLEPIV